MENSRRGRPGELCEKKKMPWELFLEICKSGDQIANCWQKCDKHFLNLTGLNSFKLENIAKWELEEIENINIITFQKNIFGQFLFCSGITPMKFTYLRKNEKLQDISTSVPKGGGGVIFVVSNFW